MQEGTVSVSRRVALGLTAAVASAAVRTATARGLETSNASTTTLTPVQVGLFSKNVATIVADRKGFWTAEGLQVTLSQVTGSVQQAQALASGQYQFAFCSADNTANYRLNAHNALGQRADFQIIGGQDLGLGLGLFAQKSITSAAALAGRTISVDAADSGFAYVLYAILSSSGLQPSQYSVTALGGTAARYSALLNGQTDATLLSAGFDVRAAALGYPELGSASQLVRPYLGSIIEASQRWMRANPKIVVRFLRGYYRALEWALMPANQTEATSLLQAASPGLSGPVATSIYAKQVLQADGLISDMTVSQPGLLNLLALRQAYGGFEQPRTLTELAYLSSERSGLWTDRYRRRAIDTAYGTIGDGDDDLED